MNELIIKSNKYLCKWIDNLIGIAGQADRGAKKLYISMY